MAKAIDYLHQKLKNRRGNRNKKGIAESLNNIGIIYKGQGNYAKALKNSTEALALHRK